MVTRDECKIYCGTCGAVELPIDNKLVTINYIIICIFDQFVYSTYIVHQPYIASLVNTSSTDIENERYWN